MTTIATIQREHAVIRKWQTAVAEAALPFKALQPAGPAAPAAAAAAA